MQQPDVLQAKRILIAQLALTLLLAAAALVFGTSVALSVLLGGAVCVLANTIFALLVFRQYRAQDAGALVGRFFGAEVVKLSLILGLFAIAFATKAGINPPALLVAYFAVQVLPAVVAPTWNAGRRDTGRIRER
jgi:ATP synthase protein I